MEFDRSKFNLKDDFRDNFDNNKKNETMGFENKKRCPHCGAFVPNDSLFCSECGRNMETTINNQQTSDKKGNWIVFLVLFIVSVVALVITVAAFSAQMDNLNSTITRQQTEIDELNLQLADTKAELIQGGDELEELQDMKEFVDKYVVFIEDDNSYYYHKYDCSRFKAKSFWAYNESNVPEEFSECPDCF